ncbi:hypothetical protein HQ590_04685, partial [bacterium]|nr:hypothetical protein [bacterium]
RCPVPFQSEILSWHVRDLSAVQLQEIYRAVARCRPTVIVLSMTFLHEEPKIAALLETARELAGEK